MSRADLVTLAVIALFIFCYLLEQRVADLDRKDRPRDYRL
jgi:hypothetical protein